MIIKQQDYDFSNPTFEDIVDFGSLGAKQYDGVVWKTYNIVDSEKLEILSKLSVSPEGALLIDNQSVGGSSLGTASEILNTLEEII